MKNELKIDKILDLSQRKTLPSIKNYARDSPFLLKCNCVMIILAAVKTVSDYF